MALSGTFAAAGVSATITGLSGNVDINIRATTEDAGHVTLEVSYDAGTSYTQLHDFKNNTSMVNMLLVAGDSTAVYRFRCRAIVAGGSIAYYLGQD